MRLRIFNNWIIGLLIMAPGILMAKDFPVKKTEFKKEYNKEFSVGMQDKLIIDNRYGKVDIKTWNEPRVTIDVTVTVNARNESNAQEVFDRIKIELSQGSGVVTGRTEIGDKSSWSSWWGNSNSDFKIDYMVKMPAGHSLNLSNKYGHSFVEDFSGKGDMTIKYGDLFAGNVGGDFNLSLGYGNATVGTVKEAKVNVKYSKLVMESSLDANIEIKYSKLSLDKAGAIKLTSGYDDLNFGNIESLSAYAKYSDLEIDEAKSCDVEAKYTDVRIDKLDRRGIFSLGYGGLSINHIATGFSEIDVTAKYAGIKLKTDADASYSFSANVNYASVHYPESMVIKREIDSGSSHEVSGHQNSGSGGKISIKSSYGSVKLYNR